MPLTSSAISSHRLCAYFIGILSLFASTIHQCTIENDVAFGSMSNTYILTQVFLMALLVENETHAVR